MCKMKFDYVIKRSARKSISVRVCFDNSIVVSCPKSCSLEKIERFLNSKSGWIEKHIQKNKQVFDRFNDVIEGRAVLVKGVAVPLRTGDKNYLGEEEVVLTSPNKIKSVFVRYLSGEFLDLFKDISDRIKLCSSKVSFRSYKSRWGCCDRKGEITFNYKILMLPKDLWVYVIVHELCHTVHMNHSSAFWNCVAAYLPDYKSLIKKIKQYSFVCPMYC